MRSTNGIDIVKMPITLRQQDRYRVACSQRGHNSVALGTAILRQQDRYRVACNQRGHNSVALGTVILRQQGQIESGVQPERTQQRGFRNSDIETARTDREWRATREDTTAWL
jgi:azurin